MNENEVAPLVHRPSYELSPSAEMTEVLQYTDWFVAGTGDSREHYRYRRYFETMQHLPLSQRRQVHVDVGCGVGLFSWVFLDWATGKMLDFKRLRLFGLDQNRTSLDLASRLREKLSLVVPSYPKLRYYEKAETLSRNLIKRHLKGSDYVITFGHVLAQSHSSEEIRQFTGVIRSALEVMEEGCRCTLVAVDARGATWAFGQGWNQLLSSLNQSDIDYEDCCLPKSYINGPADRKMATLHSHP